MASTTLRPAAVNETELMEDKRSWIMFSRLLIDELKLSSVDDGNENVREVEDLIPVAEYTQPLTMHLETKILKI